MRIASIVTLSTLLALPALPAQDRTPSGKAAEPLNRFALDVYPRILQQEGPKNVFISPLSISLCLSMVAEGAAGQTFTAMAKTLGQPAGITRPELLKASSLLQDDLASAEPKVKLDIANSLWLRQGRRFQPDFLKCVKAGYGADATVLNFALPRSAATINDWVNEHTSGKIKKIVGDTLPSDAVLIALNAIYFKGAWTEAFDPRKTRDEVFHRAAGGDKKVPLMHACVDAGWLETDAFQAVRLTFGKAGRISFLVFLPKPDSSLEAFHRDLTAANWAEWIPQFRPADVDLDLPRFKLVGDPVNLASILKDAGMAPAFDAHKADFSRMSSDRNISLSDVMHKTFLEVNEEGAEAAAVTGVVATGGRAPSPPKAMRVDRPFFCAIHDSKTGAILFMGSIVDP